MCDFNVCYILAWFSLQEVPPTIGCLRKLSCLNLDENLLEYIPDEVSGQDHGFYVAFVCVCVCVFMVVYLIRGQVLQLVTTYYIHVCVQNCTSGKFYCR